MDVTKGGNKWGIWKVGVGGWGVVGRLEGDKNAASQLLIQQQQLYLSEGGTYFLSEI